MNTRARARHDHRRTGIVLTLLAVLLGGGLIAWPPSTSPRPQAAASAPVAADEVRRRFDEAVVMLHAKQYDHAIAALHRVLVLAPNLPEAHVNMGFALLGLQRHQEALGFFDGATALAPSQANAYYGLALAYEAAGDLPMATGAMRSYLHMARAERPEHLSRARAALWEWEQASRPR